MVREGKENGELLINVYRVSVWGAERVLERHSCDGHATLWMH